MKLDFIGICKPILNQTCNFGSSSIDTSFAFIAMPCKCFIRLEHECGTWQTMGCKTCKFYIKAEVSLDSEVK